MFKKLLPFALSLCLVMTTSFAKTDYLWVQGDAWTKLLQQNEKLIYVSGLVDGLLFTGDETQDLLLSSGMSIEQYVAALDEFYSDEQNLPIAVPFALKIITYEFKGVDRKIIDKELEMMRAQFIERRKNK